MELHVVINGRKDLAEQLYQQLREAIATGRLSAGAQLPPSRLLAEHFTHSKVIKVFNAIFAADITDHARPHGAPDRRALPVAGDDAVAKAQVITLLDELGFDAVDAGSLDESWRFERAKPAYCVPLDQPGLKAALAAAERTVELPPVDREHTRA